MPELILLVDDELEFARVNHAEATHFEAAAGDYITEQRSLLSSKIKLHKP